MYTVSGDAHEGKAFEEALADLSEPRALHPMGPTTAARPQLLEENESLGLAHSPREVRVRAFEACPPERSGASDSGRPVPSVPRCLEVQRCMLLFVLLLGGLTLEGASSSIAGPQRLVARGIQSRTIAATVVSGKLVFARSSRETSRTRREALP